METGSSQDRCRQALVFGGGGGRWALPASSICEVNSPDLDLTARHKLEVEDFSSLFGVYSARSKRSVTLVLDGPPLRALRVDGIEEVIEFRSAFFFRLPRQLEATSCGLVRGLLLHSEQLILELVPSALAKYVRSTACADPKNLGSASPERFLLIERDKKTSQANLESGPRLHSPGRSLVFEVGGGRSFGIALPLVSGVFAIGRTLEIPFAPVGHCGIVHHERSLLCLYDIALLAGGVATRRELAIAIDVAGTSVGVVASKVTGVVEGFGGEPIVEPGGITWRARDARHVFFPDLEYWFSSAWSVSG